LVNDAMTTAFSEFPIIPTGALAGMPMPVRLRNRINVKDFGAVGNGIADDTAAVQAAFAAAMGTPDRDDGYVTRYDNRPIFFPSGAYLVNDTIQVASVMGPMIIGEGSRTTRLVYVGSKANHKPDFYGRCSLFFTNGFANGWIQGIAFVMDPSDGTDIATDNTVCFNWNWDGGPGVSPNGGFADINTTILTFVDVGFEGGTWGCLMGDAGTIFLDGLNWGNQSDTAFWINCWINNCWEGKKAGNFNCINAEWIGGSVTNCLNVGMTFGMATFIISNVRFSNPLAVCDLQCNATPIYIANCWSDSQWFLKPLMAGSVIHNCTHVPAAGAGGIGGYPVSVGSVGVTQGITIDNCKLGGILQGAGLFFLDGNTFTHPNWCNSGFLGQSSICELTNGNTLPGGSGPFNYSQLPNTINVGEGTVVSVKDAPTTAQFLQVSAGGGANHYLLNTSGQTARATIPFSAQPADGSTLNLNGSVITMLDYHVLSAAVNAVGSGGTNGTRTFTVSGGTLASGGTAATLSGTVTGGVFTAVSVTSSGRYSVPPTSPVTVTGTGVPAGASFHISITNFTPQTTTNVFRGTSRAQAIDNLALYLQRSLGLSVYAYATGSPHDTLQLRYYLYGTEGNAFTLAGSTSPAFNGTVPATLTGGTTPIWTVVGK
jgi:hypothetical protein